LREFFAVKRYSAAPVDPVMLLCFAAGRAGQRQLYGLDLAQARLL
jgi:hypothetical protein